MRVRQTKMKQTDVLYMNVNSDCTELRVVCPVAMGRQLHGGLEDI